MLEVAQSIARTDTGRHRAGNEDAAYVQAPLFVLADGMGGAQSGEVASRLAIEQFVRGLPERGTVAERLTAVAERANSVIYRSSVADPQNAGMGTTLTAACLDGDSLVLAHVGDSRAYMLREGKLRRLTEDHSLVGELVRGGRLTEEQARVHPQRSVITRALGIETMVKVDTWTYALEDGDVILLCSDGLTDMIAEADVRRAMVAAGGLEQMATALIDAANAAGGRDNITVVLVRFKQAVAGSTHDQPTQIWRLGVDFEGRPLSADASELDSPPVGAVPSPPVEGVDGAEGAEGAEGDVDAEGDGGESGDGADSVADAGDADEEPDGEAEPSSANIEAESPQAAPDQTEEDLAEEDPAEDDDAPTLVGFAPAIPPADDSDSAPAGDGSQPTETPLAKTSRRQRRKQRRVQERSHGWRRVCFFIRVLGRTLAVLAVVAGLGAGAYFASRQYYFVGTNSQGVIVMYRGVPYNLPFGLKLYTTYYESGTPAQAIPASRRSAILDHDLRSRASAAALVNDIELGEING